MIRRIVIIFSIIAAAFTASAQPVFKGGEDALNKFLKDKIIYPDFASKNCISAVIQVRFRLHKDGSVNDVRVQHGQGIDLDEEAVRVIKLTAGKWELPEGTEALTVIQPVRFTPDAARCTSSTKLSREQAIIAYQNRQEQENVVTNYYKNKHQGKADTTKGTYIELLKQQLGFDETFIDDLLEQAAEKEKQGDKEGAHNDRLFIRNIGSNKADAFLKPYSNK